MSKASPKVKAKAIPSKDDIFGWFIWHKIDYTGKISPSDCTRWLKEWNSNTVTHWHKFLSDLYPDYGNKFDEPKDNDSLRLERSSTRGGPIRGLKANSPIVGGPSNHKANGRKVKRDKGTSGTTATTFG